jgi:hypothetical protein
MSKAGGWRTRAGIGLCILGLGACQAREPAETPAEAEPAFEHPAVERPGDEWMTPVPSTPPTSPTEPDLRDIERPDTIFDGRRDRSEFDAQRMYRSPQPPVRVAFGVSRQHRAAAPPHAPVASQLPTPTGTS